MRADKIAKGLCYYCDQKYDQNHKCKLKETQLFTVEIGGEVDQDSVPNLMRKSNKLMKP